MSDVYGPVVMGSGEGEPIRLPPLIDHLDRFVPLGVIWDGRCFEFTDHGVVEVEGWSGDLGNGLTYDLRGGWDPEWDFEL